MNIHQSIQELLFDHECVIIPEFGGFVTNYKPAFVHPKKQLIFPPSKQVTFNVNLGNNDGLLANYISRKEQIRYDAALTYVNSTVKEFKEQLNTGKRLSINGVGTISVNSSGALEFSPEDTHNFLRSSFGLKPIFLPTLEELAPEPAAAAVTAPQETPVISIVEPTAEKKERKFNKKWLVAAAFLPLMYFGGMTVHQNSSQISGFFSGWGTSKQITAEFTPRIEGEKIQFTYEEPTSQLRLIADQNPELQSIIYSFEEGEISPNGTKVLMNKVVDSAIATPNNSSTTSKAYEKTSSGLQLYFVVAGCFQDQNNADGLVNKLRKKGFDAGIFGKKGSLHMVCYGSYTNRSAAKTALTEIKSSENPGAWLKKH
ncbi:MAG: SPOR domain-containing protein [Flavobacteriales bacterium]